MGNKGKSKNRRVAAAASAARALAERAVGTSTSTSASTSRNGSSSGSTSIAASPKHSDVEAVASKEINAAQDKAAAVAAAQKEFRDDEDFIAFDLGDASSPSDKKSSKKKDRKRKTREEDAEAESSGSGRGPSEKQHKRDRGSLASRLAPASGRSSPVKHGKKRARDDDDEDDENQYTYAQGGRAANRGTPWASNIDWAGCHNAAQALHREIVAFDQFLAPTVEEHDTRKMVVELIRRGIKNKWKDSEVLSFGSQETQLYLPQGDLDLVVISKAMEQQSSQKVLHAMAAVLRQNNIAKDILVIAKARVPIVKFTTLPTLGNFKVDISLNRLNGVAAADFVNRWLDRQPAVRPLVMCIKCLLQQRGLSEVFSGGLGSFSVILMVISFLQLHPKVQRKEIDPCENLGVLFLEFLELYGKNFGYDNVGITVRGDGGYFSKARSGWKDERKPFLLSIEDPLQTDNDISKSTFNILQVRQTLASTFDILSSAMCQRAMDMRFDPSLRSLAPRSSNHHKRYQSADDRAREALLEDTTGRALEKDPRSILGVIMGTSKELLKHRRQISAIFHSGVLQGRLGRPTPDVRNPQPGPSSSSYRAEKRARKDSAFEDRRGKENRDAAEVKGLKRSRTRDTPEIVDEEELADSQGFSFSSKKRNKQASGTVQPGTIEEAQNEGEDAADSKYAEQKKGKGRSAQNSPDSFVEDESGDESEGDDDIGLPTIVSSQKSATGKSKLSAKDRQDFWASKAIASNVPVVLYDPEDSAP